MKQVKILAGISGSGKSTYSNLFQSAHICSADKFFTDADGNYNFNPALLGGAHGACLRDFAGWLQTGGSDLLIVDNTNTTVAEVAPYAALALAFGYELEIVIFKIKDREDMEKCVTRNTHGVGVRGIEGQCARLQSLKKSLPPWWPVTEIEVEF